MWMRQRQKMEKVGRPVQGKEGRKCEETGQTDGEGLLSWGEHSVSA